MSFPHIHQQHRNRRTEIGNRKLARKPIREIGKPKNTRAKRETKNRIYAYFHLRNGVFSFIDGYSYGTGCLE